MTYQQAKAAIDQCDIRKIKEDKIPYGALNFAADKLNVHGNIARRIWNAFQANVVAGLSSTHKGQAVKNCGRKKKNRNQIKVQLKTVDKRDRTSLRRLSEVVNNVPPGTFWNLKKEGKIRSHSSAIKKCVKMKQEF